MKKINEIKKLREIIPLISLSEAKKLIEKYSEVSICVDKFHQNNINIICRLSECYDKTKVEKYYKRLNYNIEKTINKIHSELFYLTTRPNINLRFDKIGFILWEENEELDKYITSRDKSLFIPTNDFDYVIDIFRSIYPIKNRFNSELEDNFDTCGHNHFDNGTCRKIVRKLAEIETENPDVEKFIRDLIKWFNIRLRYAEWIVVYGNL